MLIVLGSTISTIGRVYVIIERKKRWLFILISYSFCISIPAFEMTINVIHDC